MRNLPVSTLFDQLDRLPAGPARDALALAVDRACAQRYASVSRLCWYTDLARARAASARLGRPILALRLLGHLDEDLSCANSRLFRTILYANAEVSRLLRERFVLVWTSERPVPRVTIDFGDGRTLATTTTGNSAHYVLDAAGRVLDVLPGLYAPAVFRRELDASLELAERRPDAAAIARHHRERSARATPTVVESSMEPRHPSAARTTGSSSRSSLAAAQRATMTKRLVEVPTLRDIGADAGELDPGRWAAIGRDLYGTHVLDRQSRALIERLHDAGPLAATRAERAAMIERLEASVVADTALNELELRPQISCRIVELAGAADFAALNAWVYEHVFHTPARDPWLGLVPRRDFTGLPGDGIAMS